MQRAAIWHWYLLSCFFLFIFFFIASVHSFFFFFYLFFFIYGFFFVVVVFQSGIDKSTEWSTIPACPSLMCFFNRGHTEGTNSLKNLCLMFVYVFHVNLCQD